MNFKNKKAFTLIELVTVIAVIAVLATILIPSVSKVMDSAKRSEACSNLRQIATAYFSHISTGFGDKGIGHGNIYDWMEDFAIKTNINDPRVWILKQDPLLRASSKDIPKSMVFKSMDGKVNEFNQDLHHFPISFAVASGVGSLVNASTTPIVWTRGLSKNGYWEDRGIYGKEGGFIGFLDGHVEWFNDLNENGGQLVHYVTRRPTANILDALPPGASVLDYSGNLYNN